MKRLIACIMLLALCLASCASAPESAPDLTALEQAVREYNEQSLRETAFRLGVSEKDKDEVLFFTSGNSALRKSDPIAMSGRMTQIENGNATTGDIFYKAGAYYYDSGYGKYYTVMDRAEFLAQFICADFPYSAENAHSYKTAETDGGVKHSYKADCLPELFASLYGESIYQAAALRKPDRARTEFSEASYEYIIKNGKLKAAKLVFTATLYDSAAYYPAYTPTDSELKHEYTVTVELSVTATGEGIEIVVPDTKEYTFLG